MTQISDELVERMAALLHAIHPSGDRAHVWDDELGDECRAIVAKLPVPVDPDLVLARKCADDIAGKSFQANWSRNEASVQAALAAIKRVRAGA